MPNQGEARVSFRGASVEVFVTDGDVREHLALSGQGTEDPVLTLQAIARSKVSELAAESGSVRVTVEAPEVLDDAINWDSLGRTASRKHAADGNPATKQANDCLKIAKTLSNLLNELAGMDQTSREQIAQAAGLQQLPESVDRLYELADQLRMGGVQNLQVQQAYFGWDPDRLHRMGKPLVDAEERPIEVVTDPAERFQAPNQEASDAHAPEVRMDK